MLANVSVNRGTTFWGNDMITNSITHDDIQHKLRSLQKMVEIHGGELTIHSGGVELSRDGSVTIFKAACLLSESVQEHYDGGE